MNLKIEPGESLRAKAEEFKGVADEYERDAAMIDAEIEWAPTWLAEHLKLASEINSGLSNHCRAYSALLHRMSDGYDRRYRMALDEKRKRR